ncbi:MAG TPA: hypothetical protein VGP47_02825 [Parachlamydiaceae bacterium]|nr:hypothetical protein [Parachlamydiaceae bacterium]
MDKRDFFIAQNIKNEHRCRDAQRNNKNKKHNMIGRMDRIKQKGMIGCVGCSTGRLGLEKVFVA